MVKSKKNPYKKMMSNVRMSSQNAGSTRKVADTHKRELKVGKKGELYREHKQHFVDITWEDLEKQFKKQNGRCYYLPNYKIDLDEIFVSWAIKAPSVDRIDDTKGYVKGNVVITTRFLNLGRGKYPEKDFREFLSEITSK